MFSTDDIRTRVRQQPFVPMRLVLSTGQTYDINHPELIMVGRRDLIIGLPSSDDPTVYEQATQVAILHVVEIRNLPSPAAAPKNGEP